MTDYYPLIAKATAGLEKNTGDQRRALYERARTALVAQLRGLVPPLTESEITRERLALEESIRKVESEAARKARQETPRIDPVTLTRPLDLPRRAKTPPLTDNGFKGFREVVAEAESVSDTVAQADRSTRASYASVLTDPVAELARLIGQDEAFGAIVRNSTAHRRPASPEEQIAETWNRLSSRLNQEQYGAKFEIANDVLRFSRTANETDRETAADPTAQKLQSEIRRKARELSDRTIRLSNQPAWGGLAEAAGLLARALDRPSIEIADDIATIWSLSVSLGAYIEQDEHARANPRENINGLEGDVIRILRDLVITAAPWVRRFPTARSLDDEAREFQSARTDVESASKLLQRAEQVAALRVDDAKTLSVALDAGNRDAASANKARGWGIRTVRNLGCVCIAGLGAIYLGFGKEIGVQIAKDSVIAKKIEKVILDGEKELIEILAHLPPDIRAALRAILAVVRRNQTTR
jgi:hypothetical protein